MAVKEPGRKTPGDGISAFMVCQTPPLYEALGVDPDDFPSSSYAVTAGGPSRCCMSPPGENGLEP